MAKQDRREHSTPGIGPRLSIEAHASAANARRKNLQAFAPVHPSMVRQGNLGHAVTKSQVPAQPINASPHTGRPTPLPALHENAHSAPHGSAKNHSPALGDRILDEVFDQGAVNNAIEGERHHSTVGPKGTGDVAVDKLPTKPADSTTTTGGLMTQYRKWANGDGEC